MDITVIRIVIVVMSISFLSFILFIVHFALKQKRMREKALERLGFPRTDNVPVTTLANYEVTIQRKPCFVAV